MRQARTRPLTLAAVAVVALAAAAYWGYDAYSTSRARKTAAALALNTSEHLRAALLTQAPGQPPQSAGAVAGLEAHAAAVAQNYATLRRLDPAVLGTLWHAADDYVLTSGEILRRIAVSARARLNLAASSQVLRDHMRADRGAATWPGQAVRLRERVDLDYREYRLAAEALAKLVESLPVSQDRIAAQLDPSLRIDPPLIAAVRTETLAAAKHLAADIGQLTDLATYR